MTRKSLLLCTAMAFAAANPQNALSESLDAAQSGIRLAQAPVPDDKRPPGQHPPGTAAPPGRPGTPATQQPPHPGTPPAAAQTPPGQPPHVPPAAAQTPPGQPPHVPPATAQTPPGQPPHVPPAAAQTPPGQPPHVPPAAAQTPPGQPPHVPPAAAQTPPGQPPHVPPAAAQMPPGQPHVPPPAAAQTTPGVRPATPGVATPAATQGVPSLQQRPAVAATPIDPKTQPQRLDQVKAQRTETHEGNTTVIRESNRTIIQEGGQTIIRHDPSDRFRLNAQAVNVSTRGNITVTAVVQPGGFQVVTETDVNGRLLRRIRRDASGREVILIDNSFEPRGPGIAGFVLDLRPPVVTIAPQLYVRDVGPATTLVDISATLMAPPVMAIERRYALDEILYNEPLRARMPRIDIDTVNFETGSWEIAADQADRLAFVAQGVLAAIKRNPGEMFLVEGYTDAVGNDVDNLSLSDHRAESVAVMLTSQFGVPAENLTTQGYGKQFLKVPTPGPERANRRVAVRRITPLLNGGQS